MTPDPVDQWPTDDSGMAFRYGPRSVARSSANVVASVVRLRYIETDQPW